MRSYEIWSEGFITNGESSDATYHGQFKASSFPKAVALWKETLSKDSKNLVNLNKLTFWGCRLYDNEKEARESFG